MNALITEGLDDGHFAAALVEDINIKAGTMVCSIENYTAMGSLSETDLVKDLAGKVGEIRRGNIRRIGILIDQDLFTEENRLIFINSVIKKAFNKENLIKNTNKLYVVDVGEDSSVEIACHFMNVNGTGELETVLKAIKTKDSPHADCLNTWKACLEAQGETIKEKEFVKSWIRDYLRLDTCSSSNFRGNKGKYCSMNCLDNVLARKEDKAVFNLRANELDNLRAFLSLFNN
jgi:hypothetical protein